MVDCVYICSAAHSGSTLLDLLLGSHSKATSLGQVVQLPKNLALNAPCACGAAVRSCDFWQRIVRALGDQIGADLMANPYALNLGYHRSTVSVDKSHQTAAYLVRRRLALALAFLQLRFGLNFPRPFAGPFDQSMDNLLLLYDLVRQIVGTDMVVDSSKSYLVAAALYRKRPDKVRVILLRRDGRGVMYSQIKRQRSRKRGLNSWMKYYTRAIPLLETVVSPEHLLYVKYEDLATQPEEELRRICHFIDLDYQAAMLDYTGSVHHNANGNDVRFSTTSTIRLDTLWEEELSVEDQLFFERSAGTLNRSLGYS